MVHNHCFGCGPDNPHGLRIKSFWSGEREAICRFTPQPYHCSGPTRFVYGGIVASIMDCHTVCTAMANAYRQAGRAIGSAPTLLFVTGRLEVDYRKPVPIDSELLVKAHILDVGERKTILRGEVWAGAELCAEARVVAVNVGSAWDA
jgi:acyl-coenzyme A thioesterase PaaI-like protein